MVRKKAAKKAQKKFWVSIADVFVSQHRQETRPH